METVSPVTLYLNQLGSEESKRVTLGGLNKISSILSGGEIKNAYEFDWENVRFEHAVTLKSKLMQIMKPESANRILCNFRRILENTWLLGKMSADDFQRTIRVTPVTGKSLTKGRALEKSEIHHLLDSCDFDTNTNLGIRDKALIAILYTAGLRRNELSQMLLSDYDKEEKTIIIHGKRNKTEKMQLIDETIEYLEKWIEVRGKHDGYLFNPMTIHGRALNHNLSTDGIYLVLSVRAKKLGIEKFTPHDLRRSFASHLLESKVDILVVSSLLRHESIATTQKYDKRNKDKLKKDALNLLEM